MNDNVPSSSSYGIVGTITLRGKSAVVWFGWGDIEPGGSSDIVTEKEDGVVSVGNGAYISSTFFKYVHKICLLSLSILISHIILFRYMLHMFMLISIYNTQSFIYYKANHQWDHWLYQQYHQSEEIKGYQPQHNYLEGQMKKI